MSLNKINHSGNVSSALCNSLGIKPDQKIVAVWGYPDPQVLESVLKEYSDNALVDLDIPYGALETKLLPENYCKIIGNIIDNAMALQDRIDVVVASIGEEKCDQGRFAAYILKQQGFNVIETRYTQYDKPAEVQEISTCSLPLKQKVLLIMDSLFDPGLLNGKQIEKCTPSHGFWGVPPNDLGVLELFPDSTHIYGWVRCVEARRPADLDIETFVDENVPTVFFAQTFCAKMQLAKYLAQKYDGLYVDVDDMMSTSVRAKIEAFLRLT